MDFDVSVASCAYDGVGVYVTPRAAFVRAKDLESSSDAVCVRGKAQSSPHCEGMFSCGCSSLMVSSSLLLNFSVNILYSTTSAVSKHSSSIRIVLMKTSALRKKAFLLKRVVANASK